MPIKKSFLEKNVFYRIAKVLFLILPLLVAIVFYVMGKININFLLQGQKVIADTLQNNVNYIVYIVLAVVAYYLLIKLVRKIFFYIAFGGLEDDTKKEVAIVAQPAGVSAKPAMVPADKKEVGFLISVLIIIACVYYAYFIYKSPSPIPGPGPNPGPTCVSTGCGSLWLCNGTYYLDGVQKRVNGCYSSSSRPSVLYSSWSGTCRQCP